MALLGFVLCRKQAPLKRWISVRWKLGVLVQCVISPLGTLSEMPPPPHCTEWRPVPAFLCSAQAREVTKWKGCGCQAESLPGAARTGSGEPPPPPSCALQEKCPLCVPFSCGWESKKALVPLLCAEPVLTAGQPCAAQALGCVFFSFFTTLSKVVFAF